MNVAPIQRHTSCLPISLETTLTTRLGSFLKCGGCSLLLEPLLILIFPLHRLSDFQNCLSAATSFRIHHLRSLIIFVLGPIWADDATFSDSCSPKRFIIQETLHTKQRDPRRPSCYTQSSCTTLVVNQKQATPTNGKKKLNYFLVVG